MNTDHFVKAEVKKTQFLFLFVFIQYQCESKAEPDECCHCNRTVQWIIRC